MEDPCPLGLEGFSLWGSRDGRQRLSELGLFAEGHQPKVFERKREVEFIYKNI